MRKIEREERKKGERGKINKERRERKIIEKDVSECNGYDGGMN